MPKLDCNLCLQNVSCKHEGDTVVAVVAVVAIVAFVAVVAFAVVAFAVVTAVAVAVAAAIVPECDACATEMLSLLLLRKH